MAGEIDAGVAHVKIKAKDDTRSGLRSVASGLLADARGVFDSLNAQLDGLFGVGKKLLGPLAGVGGISGIGAAAFKADKLLQEQSPGYESPIKGLLDSTNKAFEELGFAVLPLVNALTDVMKPVVDMLTETLVSNAPLIAQALAGFADGLQEIYKWATKAATAIVDFAKEAWDAIKAFGKEHPTTLAALSPAAALLTGLGSDGGVDGGKRAGSYIREATWGDKVLLQYEKIKAARQNMVGKIPDMNVTAPTALERHSAAEQDWLAQKQTDDTLKDIHRELRDIKDAINRQNKPDDQKVMEVPK